MPMNPSSPKRTLKPAPVGGDTARRRGRSFLLCLACILITASVFWGVVGGEFCWDDRLLITNNTQAIDEWDDIARAFTHPLGSKNAGYYRPVLLTTFIIERQLFGQTPAVFHRTNLILHCMNVALVWVLLFALTRSDLGATFGALLFALHPIQVQAVALIAGRHDQLLLPALVALLMAYRAWWKARDRRRQLLHVVLVTIYAWALWTKETALLLPVLLVLADALILPRPMPTRRARLALHLSLAAIAVVYLLVRWQIFGTPFGGGQYGNPDIGQRLAMVVATYGYYLERLIVPFELAATPFYARLIDPTSVEFWRAVFVDSAAVILFLVAWRRWPTIAFGLGLIFLWVLPGAGLIPVKTYMLEPRIYPALLGAALIVATVLQRVTVSAAPSEGLAAWLAWPSVGAALIVVACGFASKQRLPQFRDELSLWTATVAAVPESAYARDSLGYALMQVQRDAEALSELRQAVRLDGDDPSARFNLAWLLERDGNRAEAISELSELLRRHPDDLAALNSLGAFLLRAGKLDEARQVLDRGLRLDADNQNLLFNLGNLLEAQNQLDRAANTYQRLTELAPRSQQYWQALARSLRKTQKYPEAVAAYERALAIGPESGFLHFALGWALWKEGKGAQATSHAQRAQQLGYKDHSLLDELAKEGFLRQ